jgi:riboflavin kinase/FMN adenylyltransferase
MHGAQRFAIGNFDGVHLGHQAVIEAAVQKARVLDVPAAVLTFEPHPRMLFKPDSEPFRLTPLRPKAHAIEGLGVDIMVVLAFDHALSQKSAEDFVDDVLMIGMAATHVVVGSDFVFGHDRLGTVDRLIEMGGRARFAVTALSPVAGPDGTIYSSTAVRQALKSGEPRRAAALLEGHGKSRAGSSTAMSAAGNSDSPPPYQPRRLSEARLRRLCGRSRHRSWRCDGLASGRRQSGSPSDGGRSDRAA